MLPLTVSVVTEPARARRRVDAAQFGLHRLALALIAMQAGVLVVSALLYRALGLSLDWTTLGGSPIVVAVTFGIWFYFYSFPGRQHEWLFAEAALILCLFLIFAHIAPPSQYVAVALKRPLIDSWLARADAQLGISVPALTAWSSTHPFISTVLRRSYSSLLPQFVLPILILGPVLGNRRHMWEYAFHFHFCSVVTIVALALFPAECVFTHYGFDSLINQTRFIRHFHGFRDGTLTVIRLNDLEGLISFPSFHVAGGMMVTWAFRQHRWFFLPLLCLNVMLTAATFMLGAHYFVDILATIAMFAASVAVYKRWCDRWVPARPRA